MKATTNYNLPLYEPNDLANLSDGYNNAMDILDTSVKAVEDFVQTYDKAIEDNAAAIAAETSRATAAEKVNADAISAEVSRATAAEKVNADAISAEVSRATAAEKVNADNIAAEVTRATAAESAIARDYVIIGDSYGTGYTSEGTITNYIDLLKNNIAENIYSNAVGGALFDNSSNVSFTKLLDTVIQNTTTAQRDIVKSILVVGGFNNAYSDASTIQTDIAAFKTKMKTNFKNANLIVVFVGTCITGKTTGAHVNVKWENIHNAFNNYVIACYNENVTFVDFACVCKSESALSSDCVHPNALGQKYIASGLLNIINGGTPVTTYKSVSNVTDGTYTIPFVNDIYHCDIDGVRNARPFPGAHSIKFDTNQKLNGSGILVTTFNANSIIDVGSLKSHMLQGTAIVNVENHYYVIPCNWCIDNEYKMYAYPAFVLPTSTTDYYSGAATINLML